MNLKIADEFKRLKTTMTVENFCSTGTTTCSTTIKKPQQQQR